MHKLYLYLLKNEHSGYNEVKIRRIWDSKFLWWVIRCWHSQSHINIGQMLTGVFSLLYTKIRFLNTDIIHILIWIKVFILLFCDLYLNVWFNLRVSHLKISIYFEIQFNPWVMWTLLLLKVLYAYSWCHTIDILNLYFINLKASIQDI